MKFINYITVASLIVGCSQSFAKSSHKITAKDIGRHGFVIKCPGEYYLTEDVVYDPACGSNPAIRISVLAGGNVTLDLKGKTLSQKSKDVLNVDGVLIEPGLTNVIVKKGTIRDFSDAGIRAGVITASPASSVPNVYMKNLSHGKIGPDLIKRLQTHTAALASMPTLAADPLVTELGISDIRAFNNGLATAIVDPLGLGDGMGGAVILNAQDVTINDCDFNENFRAGMWAFNVTKFTMDDCHCDDNLGANSVIPGNLTADGAEVGGISADVAIRKCTFNRNSSGNSAYGFNSGATYGTSVMTNLLLDSCQFNDTNVNLSDPFVASVAAVTGGVSILGFVAIFATNLTVNNCEANGTSLTLTVPMTPTFPPYGGPTCSINGISIGFGSNNVKITNSSASGQIFQNNSGVGDRVFNQGFEFFAVENIYVANCHSHGNMNFDTYTPSLLLAEGFDLAAIGNAVIEGCSANGHKQAATNPTPNVSFVVGFKANIFEPQFFPSGPVVFRRCVATGNTDTGTSDGLAFGFSTREPQSPGDINTPFVFDSCIAEGNTTNSGTGTGFDLFNLADSKVINCIAEKNNIGINVTDFAPGASNDNIISDNVLSANTVFGIQDLSAGAVVATVTGSISGTVLTVTSAPPPNVMVVGMTLSGAGIASGTTVVSFGTGTGGIGTYNVSIPQTVPSETISGSLSTNAYYSNRAKNNGPTPATTNYSGAIFPAAACPPTCPAQSIPGTPVLFWQLPFAPCNQNSNCVAPTVLDNLSIVN